MKKTALTIMTLLMVHYLSGQVSLTAIGGGTTDVVLGDTEVVAAYELSWNEPFTNNSSTFQFPNYGDEIQKFDLYAEIQDATVKF